MISCEITYFEPENIVHGNITFIHMTNSNRCSKYRKGRCGRDRMQSMPITTEVRITLRRGVFDTTFLLVLLFPPPIKLTTTI